MFEEISKNNECEKGMNHALHYGNELLQPHIAYVVHNNKQKR